MSIFRRISDIVSANVNDLIDRVKKGGNRAGPSGRIEFSD